MLMNCELNYIYLSESWNRLMCPHVARGGINFNRLYLQIALKAGGGMAKKAVFMEQSQSRVQSVGHR